MKRQLMLAAAVLAAGGAFGLIAPAEAYGPGGYRDAPPPPRAEGRPMNRPGQVWVPGHYEGGRGGYAWRGGYWQNARPGYRFVPDRWVQTPRGWVMRPGRWVR